MAVVLPDGVDTILDLIGVGWPNVDEDAYRDMATDLRDFADDVDDDAHAAHRSIQRLISSGDSEALTALNGHWGKVRTKHLKDLADAARIFAGALDAAADIIEARKWVAVGELAACAASAGISLAAAPFTAGLSSLIGAGAIQACRIAVRRAIKEMTELAVEKIVTAMTEPAVVALENMAAELVVQLAANGLGIQDGIDTGRITGAGKEGFTDGVQSGKESLHLASADGPGAGGSPPLGKLLGTLEIDHGEHDRAATKLNGVSASLTGRTRGKLTKAKANHNRTRGKDDIAQAIDTVADKMMGAIEKATKQLGEHLGGGLPKGVRNISDSHKENERRTRDRFDKINTPDGPDGRGRGPGGDGPGGGPPPGGGGGSGDGGTGGRRMDPQPTWHGRSAGKMRHHRRDALQVDHLPQEERIRVLEEESLNLANAARDQKAGPSGDYPIGRDRLTTGCSGSLLHDGVITSHTSTTKKHGMKLPETHPVVADALNQTEAKITAEGKDKGIGHGKCAEVSLVSDRLHQLDPDGTKIRTVEDARKALSGAVVHTRQIGDSRSGTILHGDYKPPCNSCTHMLPILGVAAHK